MALINPDVFKNLLQYSKVQIHPEIRDKLYDVIKKRFEKEITPELWNDLLLSYSDDSHDLSDFLTVSNEIVRDVVKEYFNKIKDQENDEGLIDHWVEILWDDSQSFWYELSEPIKNNIDFLGALISNSRNEILELYPDCEIVFGEKAYQFLLDLALQDNIRGYTKISKPDLVDLRRMLNISGQIVEEIFSTKIFKKEVSIGDLYRQLESFSREDSAERKEYFKIVPAGNILLNKSFLENLKILVRMRNPYSHGGSKDKTLEKDSSDAIRALIVGQYGVLNVLYKLLKDIR